MNPPILKDEDIKNEKTQSGIIDEIPSKDKKQMGQNINIKMVEIPKFNKKNRLAEMKMVAELKKPLLINFSGRMVMMGISVILIFKYQSFFALEANIPQPPEPIRKPNP